MSNILLEYMNKRIQKEQINVFEEGPVITISRAYGCEANPIAQNLALEISKQSPNVWHYINKEILEDSARELNVSKRNIEDVFGAKRKGFLGDIIVSFSNKKYKSDGMILNTIHSVVRKYAEQGNIVIVGRAGCSIASDIKKSLHIRLSAPFSHRVRTIKENYSLSEKEARKKVNENDELRNKFLGYFSGKRSIKDLFDIELNTSKLSAEEITSILMNTIRIKGLI